MCASPRSYKSVHFPDPRYAASVHPSKPFLAVTTHIFMPSHASAAFAVAVCSINTTSDVFTNPYPSSSLKPLALPLTHAQTLPWRLAIRYR